MKFYNYLNEGRSVKYDIDEIKEIILENCWDSLERYQSGHKIYRSKKDTGDYIVTTPTGNRKSAYTSNYYTLWINNHKSWKKFPKREIICAGGSGERAYDHEGQCVYVVLPFDNAKIGICPKDDIWDSFYNGLKLFKKTTNQNIFDLSELNKLIREYFHIYDDNNWKNFVKETQKIDLGRGISLYDVLEDTFDPKLNDFEMVPISKYNLNESDNVEVWTDSPCVLIKDNYIEELIEMINEE